MRYLAKAFLIILIAGTSLAKAEEGKIIPEKCNFAPTSKITNTPTGLVFRSGSEVQFSGTTSTPNNCSGSITEYRWKIEGVYSYSSTKSHTFTLPAGVHEQTYSVELRVRNNINLYNTKTITVTVKRPQRVYHLRDHLGSVRTSVDVDGNVLGHDDYYAFGLSMPGAHSSNTSNPNDNYKFTGHERDDEAGLTIDYMNARNYDPVIGRFMQVDPMLQYSSPYTYVGNNPLLFVDPTGMLGDYFDGNGNHLGSDGIDDGRVYIADKGKSKGVKKSLQKGEVADARSSSTEAPGLNVLMESIGVLSRARRNGGRNEESSKVMNGGPIVRGETGPDPYVNDEGKLVATSTLPDNPAGYENHDVEATIHSHPLINTPGTDGGVFKSNAFDPSTLDHTAFKKFNVNIIVGPLGEGNRTLGLVIYNRKSETQLSVKATSASKIVQKLLGN